MTALPEQLQRLARVPHLLVASDFDGTLAPLVDHPDEAHSDPAALAALRALAALPDTQVAVISGRARADLARRLGDDGTFILVGSHGAERDAGARLVIAPAAAQRLGELAGELSALAERTPGCFVERKPAAIAFHYRRAAPAIAEAAVQEALARPALYEGLSVLPGSKVLEFCALSVGKGQALQELRGGATVLFIGDDVTDEAAFEVLQGDDLGVKVGREPTRALARVADVGEVAALLTELVALRRAHLAVATPVAPIDHLSLLSDQRTAALVDPHGGIVWACFPRIDSAALFAELLDGPDAGVFRIRPRDARGPAAQRYVGDSFVLESRWPGLTVTDFLDCGGGRAYQRAGRCDLLRIVTADAPFSIVFAPRLDFGRVATRLRRREGGLELDDTLDPIVLSAPGVAWELVSHGRHQTAVAHLGPLDQPLVLELRYGTGSLKPAPTPPEQRRSATERFWTGWAATLAPPPLATELVRRSALVLKALCYGPTGAIAAAATTSLPETLGGVRNWDYRYSWIRDAALAAAALVRIGNTGVALRLLDWLLGILERGQAPERLSPLYTVSGHDLGPEAEVGELAGYRGSRPVRLGNAASLQIQLDVFGPIVDLIALLAERGAPVSPEHWRLVQAMMSAVERRWHEPDHGIWEVRAARAHYVHSKLMCWVAADRAGRLAEQLFDAPHRDWLALRDRIRADILAHGFDAERGAFTAAYGAPDLDAATLQIGLTGFLRPDDPRFVDTVSAVERELFDACTVRRYRFDDGLPGREGGFHLCTAWLIESLWLIGRRDDARRLFDALVGLAGPTGLYSEQYDPAAGAPLGNHPQAYSHLGLINAAVRLAG